MSEAEQVESLVAEWVALHEEGRGPSVEDLCAGRPDLVEQVRVAITRHVDQEALLRRGAPGGAPPRSPGGYELVEVLGRGGMGVVYRAKQAHLGREVALKMITPGGGLLGVVEVERFRAEAEAVARLQHPNVVQLFEAGAHDGRPYYSLELCEGGSLADRLRASVLHANEASSLVEALSRALAHAHERGVVHRDLKPSNVLRTRGGVWKVSDFGVAKRLDQAGHTQTGAFLGTPAYASPEQARGQNRQVGPTSDVYALGAVLYACLTGRPPFNDPDPIETLAQVAADDPVPPGRLVPSVPRDLETICLKCLQKEPRKRYASAGELADDLGRFQRGEPIRARPVGLTGRAVKWVRRHQAVAALLAALVVGGVSALGVTFKLFRDQVAETNRAEFERDRAEISNYAGHLQAAQLELDSGNVAMARHHLEACRWDLRGWEHRHLVGRLTGGLFTFGRHSEAVKAVVFSPDGHLVASASEGGEVKVWDARSGQAVRSLKIDPGSVSRVSFSPDGSQIVRARQSDHNGDGCKAVSPDGRNVVIGGKDDLIIIRDMESGLERLSIEAHQIEVTSVIVSPDGADILSGGVDGTVKLWDARTGRCLRTLSGDAGAITSTGFSPDGRLVAAGSRRGKVLVWDVRSPARVHPLEGFDATRPKVTIRGRGDVLSVRCGRLFDFFNLRTGEQIRALPKELVDLAINNDGSRVAIIKADNRVEIWDPQGNSALHTFLTPAKVKAAALSQDGRRFAGAADGAVSVWDVVAGTELVSWKADTGQFCRFDNMLFTPDGSRIIACFRGAQIEVWEARTGRAVLKLKAPGFSVSGLDVSPGGDRIASANGDGTARVWDARTGDEVLCLTGHTDVLNSVRFMENGSRLVTGGEDQTVKLWEARTGQELLSLPGNQVNMAVPGGGDRYLFSGGGPMRVWEALPSDELLILSSPSSRFIGSTALPLGLPATPRQRVARHPLLQDAQVVATFSPDDRCILALIPDDFESVNPSGMNKVTSYQTVCWDSTTGRLIPNPYPGYHIAEATRRNRSFDGRLLLDAEAFTVKVTKAADAPIRDDRTKEMLARIAPFDAVWHHQRACEAELNLDANAAAFHLRRLIQAYPINANLHARLAHALASTGDRQGAALHVTQALLRDPSTSLWPINPLASNHGHGAAEVNDWDRASTAFRIAVRQPGATTEDWVSLMVALSRANRPAERARIAKEALVWGQKSGLGIPRALAYKERQGPPSSRAEMNTDDSTGGPPGITGSEGSGRIIFDPDRVMEGKKVVGDSGVLYWHAQVLLGPCDAETAQDVLRALRDADPAWPDLSDATLRQNLLGVAYFRAGRWRDADASFRKAMAGVRERPNQLFLDRSVASPHTLSGHGELMPILWPPEVWAYQAMTAARLGQFADARRQLGRAEAWRQTHSFPRWQDRGRWRALLEEARKVIPAVSSPTSGAP